MKVRRADESDVPALLRLVVELHRHEGLPEPGADVRAALLRLMGEPQRGRVLVAAEGGGENVVGYAVLTFGYSLEFHGVDAFIDELYVHDAKRNTGVGSLLLDAAEEECKAEGVRAMHLESGHGNPAINLYRRRGFKDHERHLLTKWL